MWEMETLVIRDDDGTGVVRSEEWNCLWKRTKIANVDSGCKVSKN